MDGPLIIALEELPNGDALDRAQEEVQTTLAQGGSRLARLKWPLVRDTVATAMHDRLREVDAFSVLLNAWSIAREVRESAKRTKANPGLEEPLALGEHTLSAELHPIVSVRCGPLHLSPLRFTVALNAMVECVVLTIADGCLATVEGLALTPSATIKYGEMELKHISGERIAMTGAHVLSGGGLPIPCD